MLIVKFIFSSFANRAKNIKNSARINEDPKDAMLREFQKEINELKQILADEGTHMQWYKIIYCGMQLVPVMNPKVMRVLVIMLGKNYVEV